MRLQPLVACILLSSLTTACHKGTNPVDPWEPFNRKVYAFNMAVDSAVIKPPAKLYKAVVPARVRKGINNAYNNLDMIPTVGNDLLQAQGKWAIKDTWRFIINSSLGVAGFFDVAATFGLPPHSNDLGLTLAKWGDKNSPYLMLPILGPSTLRDGAGWLFQFALYSPYVYIDNTTIVYSLLGLRLVDLRSQMLVTEPLMDQALDKYAFLRDAYLQHRNYLITGAAVDTGTLPNLGGDYVD